VVQGGTVPVEPCVILVIRERETEMTPLSGHGCILNSDSLDNRSLAFLILYTSRRLPARVTTLQHERYNDFLQESYAEGARVLLGYTSRLCDGLVQLVNFARSIDIHTQPHFM